ncbi:hypothetical protein [Azospirillum brasilense]|uniref:Uncharacterized protein n=1 Tax=Azospirillum brasilense TaxID=192 RepID=A0A6L3B313_AZOBR|nr:hypothetical protein [Azospirillum brasilense]KAA0686316.1 hypothetical protein DS837_11550 [Azospirillum brasilense]
MSKLEPLRPAVEVLDLRLSEGTGQTLAIAVVQVGPVEIRNVWVTDRDGRLFVRLPGTLMRKRLKPAVCLDEPVFLELVDSVLAEYRVATGADPWGDVRSASRPPLRVG